MEGSWLVDMAVAGDGHTPDFENTPWQTEAASRQDFQPGLEVRIISTQLLTGVA
jgi:hypothetical protein